MKRSLGIVAVLVVCIFILSIVSCNEEKSILELNVEEESLQHKKLNFKSDLHKINQMCVFDTLLFLEDETDDAYFALIDVNTNKIICRFGKKGKGPGEMKWPIFIKCDKYRKTFEVTAIQPKGIIEFNIDSLIKNPINYKPRVLKLDIDNKIVLTVHRLNDSIFLAKGGFREGQFAIINELGELLSIQGNYPTENESVKYDQFQLGMSYQGDIKTHPQLSKFVYTSIVGSVIEFCTLDGMYNLKKNSHYYSNFPKFKLFENTSALLPENIIGYNSLYTTDKYVYVLYSEDNMLNFADDPYMFNKILKFDWDGNLVKKYKTDIQLRTIAVSFNDKVIYGTSANPEPKIVKFDL